MVGRLGILVAALVALTFFAVPAQAEESEYKYLTIQVGAAQFVVKCDYSGQCDFTAMATQCVYDPCGGGCDLVQECMCDLVDCKDGLQTFPRLPICSVPLVDCVCDLANPNCPQYLACLSRDACGTPSPLPTLICPGAAKLYEVCYRIDPNSVEHLVPIPATDGYVEGAVRVDRYQFSVPLVGLVEELPCLVVSAIYPNSPIDLLNQIVNPCELAGFKYVGTVLAKSVSRNDAPSAGVGSVMNVCSATVTVRVLGAGPNGIPLPVKVPCIIPNLP